MRLTIEKLDKKRKEKKENSFLPFLNSLKSTPPRNFLTTNSRLPSQNSSIFWSKTLNYAAIGEKT